MPCGSSTGWRKFRAVFGDMPTTRTTKCFALGQIVATRGALAALESAGQPPLLFILRHLRGDWGEVCPEDWQANDEAVEHGDRLLSAYTTSTGERISSCTMRPSSHSVALRSDFNASSRFASQFLAVIASRHVTAARAIAAGVACSPYSPDF